MSAVTAPAVRAEAKILGTPSNPAANPAADPGSRLAPGTPGAPTTSDRTTPQEMPSADRKMLQETSPTDSDSRTVIGPLGTSSNPAADLSSREEVAGGADSNDSKQKQIENISKWGG